MFIILGMIPYFGVARSDRNGYNYAMPHPHTVRWVKSAQLWLRTRLLLLVPCAALQFLHQLGHRYTWDFRQRGRFEPPGDPQNIPKPQVSILK